VPRTQPIGVIIRRLMEEGSARTGGSAEREAGPLGRAGFACFWEEVLL